MIEARRPRFRKSFSFQRGERNGTSMKTRTDSPRRAIVTTTISRTVDGFYGQIIDALQRDGFEVHVVTSDGPETTRLARRADHVHIVTMHRRINIYADIRALFGWLRVLLIVRPVFVLAGTPKAGLLGMIASWMTRVPRRAYFLQGMRLEGIQGRQREILAKMEWLTSRCSHIVIAVSPSLADRYRDLGLAAGRPLVVPHHGSSHGVDTDYFTPRQKTLGLMDELGLDRDLPVVTFIGRLTKDKGPDTLLGALRRIRSEKAPVQLLVLGAQDEADSAHYLSEIEREPTPVTVLPHIQDVRPYLAVSDIVVLPTRREGMPNVVLEAAAMGIPSVTTDATGAVDSVVHEHTGLIVPVGDEGALAEAVLRLIQNQASRESMGRAARDRVVRDFQPEDVARAIVALGMYGHASRASRCAMEVTP
jgi:glycosyltransferase involved in cell wall biosynthesis